MLLKKGFVQIYTGDGKGKTTASLGVVLRILGNGGRVYYAQFIKGKILSSEFIALNSFAPAFEYHAFGAGRFIKGRPSAEDIRLAHNGVAQCAVAVSSGNYDLVVMDELNGALNCGIIELPEVLDALRARDAQTEVIITGRNAPAELIEEASLVSEINSVKHYFSDGVLSRKGIEF